jgi:hypothetical protein
MLRFICVTLDGRVDGLGTWQPTDPEMYAQMGRHLAGEGYNAPSIM